MITLCKACESKLLAEIAEASDGEISGFFCSHEGAAAVVLSKGGKIVYSQLCGPCSPEQAETILAETARELHRAAIAKSATVTPGALH